MSPQCSFGDLEMDKKGLVIVAYKPTEPSHFPKIGDTKVPDGSHFGDADGKTGQSRNGP